MWRPLRGILIQTVSGWLEDKAPRLGAALAYYSILALAPLVILVTLPVLISYFSRHAR